MDDRRPDVAGPLRQLAEAPFPLRAHAPRPRRADPETLRLAQEQDTGRPQAAARIRGAHGRAGPVERLQQAADL